MIRRKILSFLFFLFSVFVIIFSISNQSNVSVFFWPIPFEIDLPIFLLAGIFFISGFLSGWIYASIRGYKLRKVLSSRLKEKIDHLEVQNKMIKQNAPEDMDS